jgi:lysophospholipase L1-like esterase
VSVTSSNNQPTIVVYGAATPSGGAPPVNVSCSPVSQTLFPIGATTVTCLATDARQRTASCTFAVSVVAPPTITFTRFVAFGDSMTAGEDGNALAFSTPSASDGLRPSVIFPFTKTYPGVLQQLLASRYTAQTITVSNQGSSGERAASAQTRARFSSVLGIGRFDSVLLMEGANDVSDRDPRIFDDVMNSLRLMLRDATSRGVRPYLATIPPQVPGGSRSVLSWPLVAPFNDRVRALAASEGVTLVDVYANLVTNTGLYINNDGEHLTEAGYAKIADVFFAVLRSTLERPPTLTFSPSGGGLFSRRP